MFQYQHGFSTLDFYFIMIDSCRLIFFNLFPTVLTIYIIYLLLAVLCSHILFQWKI